MGKYQQQVQYYTNNREQKIIELLRNEKALQYIIGGLHTTSDSIN